MRSARVAAVGKALSDPSRAEILCLLSSGTPRTAGQLAAHVGLAASTTSRHLAELVDGHLLRVEVSGRHRYFSLYSADIIDLLTMIDRMDLPKTASGGIRHRAPIATARTCYDHLAGDLGVNLYRSLVADGLIKVDPTGPPHITSAGHAKFTKLGIDTAELDIARRPAVRGCLDWQEQQHHLGGGLGRALLSMMLDQGWLKPQADRRVLLVTSRGKQKFTAAFSLEVGLATGSAP